MTERRVFARYGIIAFSQVARNARRIASRETKDFHALLVSSFIMCEGGDQLVFLSFVVSEGSGLLG